jgi:RNA polymerase sigma-70 factor, ECF subfamily
MQSASLSFAPAPQGLPLLTDDADLLLRSAADDRSAFEALFARHREGLHGFLFRKLRSHEEAEDAVTLTFCNAWRARGSFRGGASGKAWLYQIATRVALDLLRRRRRRAQELELDPLKPELSETLEDGQPGPEMLVLETERVVRTRQAISQAMDRLPSDERQLVSLFYFEGYNYDEISSLVGVSRSQVRGRLHRIRGRMRRDLVTRQGWQPA